MRWDSRCRDSVNLWAREAAKPKHLCLLIKSVTETAATIGQAGWICELFWGHGVKCCLSSLHWLLSYGQYNSNSVFSVIFKFILSLSYLLLSLGASDKLWVQVLSHFSWVNIKYCLQEKWVPYSLWIPQARCKDGKNECIPSEVILTFVTKGIFECAGFCMLYYK